MAAKVDKVNVTVRNSQNCRACWLFDTSVRPAVKYCRSCKQWICSMCVDNHRRYTVMNKHDIRDVKKEKIPNLVDEIIYDPNYTTGSIDSDDLSVISITWFKSYCKYVFDPVKNASPGPVVHCEPGKQGLGTHYVTSKAAAFRLRSYFGSHQLLPLIQKNKYDRSQGIYIITMIYVTSLPKGYSKRVDTARIFHDNDKLPATRVFRENGKELKNGQLGKTVSDLVWNDLKMKVYDKLFVVK